VSWAAVAGNSKNHRKVVDAVVAVVISVHAHHLSYLITLKGALSNGSSELFTGLVELRFREITPDLHIYRWLLEDQSNPKIKSKAPNVSGIPEKYSKKFQEKKDDFRNFYHEIALKLVSHLPFLVFHARQAFVELIYIYAQKSLVEPDDAIINLFSETIIKGIQAISAPDRVVSSNVYALFHEILSLQICPSFTNSVLLNPVIFFGDSTYQVNQGVIEAWRPKLVEFLDAISTGSDPFITRKALLVQTEKYINKTSRNESAGIKPADSSSASLSTLPTPKLSFANSFSSLDYKNLHCPY